MNLRWLLPMVLCVLVIGRAAGEEKTRVIGLRVTPTQRPQPAMKYQLFPAQRDVQPGNAASQYYRAALLMSEFYRRDDFQDVGPLLEAPIDADWRRQAERQVKLYQSVIEEVRLGAWRDQAVWDIPLREQGVSTLLLEIQYARSIARVLPLEARLQVSRGEYDQAAQTLATCFAMARHVGDAGALVSSLVGVAIAGMACDQCELWIDQQDSPSLYWALTALPQPVVSLRVGLASEQLWLDGLIPNIQLLMTTVLSPQQASELAAQLGEAMEWEDRRGRLALFESAGTPAGHLLLPGLSDYARLKRQLIEQGRAEQQVEAMPVVQVLAIRWIEEWLNLMDESLAWIDRPYSEVQQAGEELNRRVAEISQLPEGRLVRILLPAMTAARSADARLSQRIAVLRTIEALRLYAGEHDGALPARLDEMTQVPVPRDPLTDRAFEYRLEGKTAVLLPQRTFEQLRYEVTVAKPEEKE